MKSECPEAFRRPLFTFSVVKEDAKPTLYCKADGTFHLVQMQTYYLIIFETSFILLLGTTLNEYVVQSGSV